MSHIKVHHEFETPAEDDLSSFTLKVWVTETSNNIPPYVFLYYKDPAVPYDTVPQSRFYRVCNYADMLNYKAVTPDSDSDYYRLNYVHIQDDSLATLDGVWDSMETDLQTLINDIVEANTSGTTVLETHIKGCS